MTETRTELGCVLGMYVVSPSWATSELMRSSFLSRSPDEALPGGLGCGSGSGHYTLERGRGAVGSEGETKTLTLGPGRC